MVISGEMLDQAKTIAGTLVIVGILISFYNLKNAPHRLLLESSPKQPAWLPWLGWAVTSVSAILYIGLDLLGS